MRTDRGISLIGYPHSEQVLELAKNLGARVNFEPYHRVLYSNMRLNSLQPTSEICLANLWF